MSERRNLIGLAYRLLGSLGDAEDAVQETYARWYAMPQAQQAAIESPGAWLTKVTSRICLNLLGSARVRRESYVGEWIPEPLPEPTDWIGGRSGAATVERSTARLPAAAARPHQGSAPWLDARVFITV
jgi:RNA polymerase sigma-70 factor (ECF subfamily)